MKVFVIAALVTPVVGFAFSNLMLFSAEVDALHCSAYQRLNIIKKLSKKRRTQITTQRRNLMFALAFDLLLLPVYYFVFHLVS